MHNREDNALSTEKFQKCYKSRKTLEFWNWNSRTLELGTCLELEYQPGTPEHLEHWKMVPANSSTSPELRNTWNIGAWYQSGTLVLARNIGTTGTLELGTSLDLSHQPGNP